MKFWSTLKEISKSKVTTSCALWIFIVPAIAKLSSSLGAHNYNDLTFEIVAPQSFVLLYFAAISFFLGTLLYTLTCPPLIKLVDNFSDFEALQMTAFNLNQSLEPLSKKESSEVISLIRQRIGKATSHMIDNERALLLEAGKGSDSIMIAPDKLRDCFWLIYDTHKARRAVAQAFVAGLYLSGFGILFYIFISNLFIVFNSL